MPSAVVIVLGCAVHGSVLSATAERRVERAARAYRELGAARVIASGGRTWYGVPEADTFAAGLEERGVPAGHITREVRSLTTRENALYTAALLRDNPADRILIVSCDWHLPRALALFARVGLVGEGVPAESPSATPWQSAVRGARERLSLRYDLALARFWCRA